jgi:hypothetical protein
MTNRFRFQIKDRDGWFYWTVKDQRRDAWLGEGRSGTWRRALAEVMDRITSVLALEYDR